MLVMVSSEDDEGFPATSKRRGDDQQLLLEHASCLFSMFTNMCNVGSSIPHKVLTIHTGNAYLCCRLIYEGIIPH